MSQVNQDKEFGKFAEEWVETMYRLSEMDDWSRKELQEYLEAWGYGVCDSESTASLLEAAKLNFLLERG